MLTSAAAKRLYLRGLSIFWQTDNRRVAVLLVIGIAGISAGLHAQETKPTDSKTPRFSVTISSTDPVVKSGSSIWVDATVKNTSGQDISVHMTNPAEFAYRIEVRNEKSARAPETKLGRERNNRTTAEDEREPVVIISKGTNSPLKTGKTITDHVDVTQMYDLSGPGKYTIQFERFDEESKTFVMSNMTTVTVIP